MWERPVSINQSNNKQKLWIAFHKSGNQKVEKVIKKSFRVFKKRFQTWKKWKTKTLDPRKKSTYIPWLKFIPEEYRLVWRIMLEQKTCSIVFTKTREFFHAISSFENIFHNHSERAQSWSFRQQAILPTRDEIKTVSINQSINQSMHEWKYLLNIHTVYGEEFLNDFRGRRFRELLTDKGHQNRPRHTTEKAQHVGIDSPPFGPQFDGPQRLPKGILIRHQTQHLIGHTKTIQAPHTLCVHSAENFRIGKLLLPLGDLLHHEPRKRQIDFHVVVVHFDDGHKGVDHFAKIGDFFLFSENVGKGANFVGGFEEIRPFNVFWSDQNRVDITALMKRFILDRAKFVINQSIHRSNICVPSIGLRVGTSQKHKRVPRHCPPDFPARPSHRPLPWSSRWPACPAPSSPRSGGGSLPRFPRHSVPEGNFWATPGARGLAQSGRPRSAGRWGRMSDPEMPWLRLLRNRRHQG